MKNATTNTATATMNAATVPHFYTVRITADNAAPYEYALCIESAARAHAHGEQTAEERRMENAAVRVYFSIMDADGNILPCGMERAALYVAYKTVRNATMRGGRENEYIMERELAACTARAAIRDDAVSIGGVVAEYGQDAREMYSAAMVGLAEGYTTKHGEVYRGVLCGGNTESAYHAAFLSVNAYVQSLRTASAAECSTEYIMDGHGDLISIGAAMARVLKQGEKYAPTDGGNMDAQTAARLGARLSAVFATLSPVQSDIVRRLSRGVSLSDIARQTGRNKSTISRNVAIIRQRFAEGMKGTQFESMVHMDAVQEGEKTARDNENTARRMREYRARKAAQKAAQSAAE